MFGDKQIPWPGLIAAATLTFVVAAAFRSSEWSHDLVNHLVVWPLMEVLRFVW
jgi:hypothetical protein